MDKYDEIFNRIYSEIKTATPLDEIYIVGMCHAVQSIALNDNTIDHRTANIIYGECQTIINKIIDF